MKEDKILLIQERTVLELFNDTIKFIIQNFKILIQLFLTVSLLFIVLPLFLNYAPSSFFQSSLYQDVSQVIYSQTSQLGFNPVYTILTGFAFSIVLYGFMNLYSKKENNITVTAVFNHLKPNIIALISMAIVSAIAVSILVECLKRLNIDFEEMFGFSLFNLSYMFLPLIIYFVFALVYVTINQQIPFVDALKKIKAYFNKPWNVLLNVLFVMIIIYILKAFITRFLFAIIAFFQFFDADTYTFVITPFLQLLFFATLFFASIYIAFLYNSQVARHEGSELMKLIDDI